MAGWHAVAAAIRRSVRDEYPECKEPDWRRWLGRLNTATIQSPEGNAAQRADLQKVSSKPQAAAGRA